MSKYAVIEIAHKQYKVEPDKTYTVDKFSAEVGDKVKLNALLIDNDGKVQIGTPTIDNAVTVEILDQGKGEKVSSYNFKAKSRYRRRYGFRKRVTTFKIVSIS